MESSALVVSCANETTKTWLKEVASEFGLGEVVEGISGVIVGEYKDLLGSYYLLNYNQTMYCHNYCITKGHKTCKWIHQFYT